MHLFLGSTCHILWPRGYSKTTKPDCCTVRGGSDVEKSSRAIFFARFVYQLSAVPRRRAGANNDSPLFGFVDVPWGFEVSHPRLHPALESSPLSGTMFFQRIGRQRRNATFVDADACCGCVATFGECHVRFLSTLPAARRKMKTEPALQLLQKDHDQSGPLLSC